MTNFKDREKEILDFWESDQTFQKSLDKPAPNGDYLFYDGPPFATGTPHYGHLVGNIMKDVVPRFWTMQGYRVERKWGWDCHGLPVENIVEKELGSKSKQAIEEMGIASFELQSTALATLLSDINTGDGADARVQALPIILPSLLLQFSESGVDDRSGDDAKEIILPELIAFVETSTSQAPSIEANPVLNSAYKEGVAIASIMINYILEQNAENSVTIVDLWENGNVDAIQECVKTWKKLSKN